MVMDLLRVVNYKLRFVTDDGFTIDWNRTIDVISGAIPSINFFQVALPDGTSASTPLGVDLHPVGGIGFGFTVESF